MEHFEDLFEKGKPPCKACLLSSAEMLLAMSKCSEFSTYQPFAVRFCALSASVDGNVISICAQCLVCGTDDLAVVRELLHAMCAPSGDTCHGKYRSVELERKVQHMIYET